MNEDFSDILSKFSDILKEKDIDLGNIRAEQNDGESDNDFSIDIDTMLKIKAIMGNMNKNKNHPRNKLLKSLNPYLENTKKEKLEQYLKIANLLSVLDVFDNDTIKKFTENDIIKKFTDNDYDLILIIILFLLLF